MPEARKRRSFGVLRVLACLGAIGVFLGLVFFFLRIWTWEPAKLSQELLLEASRILGCKVQVQRTELKRFPFPSVAWHGSALSWEKGGQGLAETLRAAPDVFSLAVGRVRISSLELAGLVLPENSWKELLQALRESLPRILGVPFFELRLSNARALAGVRGEDPLEFSNLGGRISRLLSRVETELSFDLEMPGKGALLRGVVLEVSAAGDGSSARLRRLSVEEPRLGLSGELRGISEQGFDELLLRSQSLDLETAGILLQLLHKLTPIPMELQNLLRAGRLLGLELRISGQGLFQESLGVQVRGRLQGAQLLLPGPWGLLRDLEAGLLISGGTLELSSLRARAEAGSLTGGTLRLELPSPHLVFSAELGFEADMRQLHQLLEKWVQEEPWRAQIHALYRVGGKARGRISAQGPLLSPVVRMEVQELAFLARHKAFPYALEMRGGSLLAGPEGLAFHGLTGMLGSSSFSGLSGSLDLSAEPWLDLRAGPCVLELEEIWALLRKSRASWNILENLNSLEGRLWLGELEMNGPLLEPAAWQGRGSAHLEGRVAAQVLGLRVDLWDAELELTQESLSLKKAMLEVGGEKLHLEADLLHWQGDDSMGEALVSGEIGPQIGGVLSQLLTRATGVSWKEPAGAKIIYSRTSWGPEGIAFRGELSWGEGIRVFLDLSRTEDSFRIRELKVEGAETEARFSLTAGPHAWELTMQGTISGSTLDLFTEENPLGNGWLRGEVRLGKERSPEQGLELTGELWAGAIPLGRYLGGGPWWLIQGKLLGKGRQVSLEEARLNWSEREVFLRGEGFFLKNELEVKATLQAVELGWEELSELLGLLAGGLEGYLRGNLGMRLGELRLGEALLRPFHAELNLDPSDFSLDLRYALSCGVSLSGRLQVTPGGSWALHPVARQIDSRELLGCLGVNALGFTGKADLDGEIHGEGFEAFFPQGVSGSLELLLHEGELQAGNLWAGTLEALRGLPELAEWLGKTPARGIHVSKGRANLELHRGDLRIRELWLEGNLMQVVAQGDLDLISGGLQMTVLLEPKGVKPKGSKPKGAWPLEALSLEGSFEKPRVSRLQAGKTPQALLEKIHKPKAPKTKTGPSSKARKAPAVR